MLLCKVLCHVGCRSSASSIAGSTPPTDYLDSSHAPTTAVAAAVDLDAENTVIDSIPWGVTGTATAQGTMVQTQTGGGGGGFSGGSTGGSGGGRSGGQPGGSGGKDEGGSERSWWNSLWVPALIASGGAGAAAASNSSFRQYIQDTFQAIKSSFVTGDFLLQFCAKFAHNAPLSALPCKCRGWTYAPCKQT